MRLFYIILFSCLIGFAQDCKDKLDHILKFEDKIFNDAKLHVEIINYLECINANKEKINFYKSLIYTVKHDKVFIAMNNDEKYYLINQNLDTIKSFHGRIGHSVNRNPLILSELDEGYARTEKLINFKGEVISQHYTDITYLYNDYLEVNLNGKKGVIDKDLKIVLPVIYDEIKMYPSHKNEFIVLKGNKFGVINNLGATILPIEYSTIEPIFSLKYFSVAKEDKFGVVDAQNKLIVPLEHNETKVVNDSVFIINGFDESYLCDNKGKIISKKYDYINPFFHIGNKDYTKVISDNQEGVISVLNGKEIITPLYDKVWISDDMIKIKNDNKHGVADFNGNILIPIKYNQEFFGLNSLNVNFNNGSFGLIDSNGVLKYDYNYDNIILYEDFKNKNEYAILVKNNKTEILDIKSNAILKKFDFYVGDIFDNFLWVEKNGLWGTFNMEKNHFIIEPKFDNPLLTFKNGIGLVVHADKYGVINYRGEEISPAIYDDYDESYISNSSVLKMFLKGKKVFINLFGIIE